MRQTSGAVQALGEGARVTGSLQNRGPDRPEIVSGWARMTGPERRVRSPSPGRRRAVPRRGPRSLGQDRVGRDFHCRGRALAGLPARAVDAQRRSGVDPVFDDVGSSAPGGIRTPSLLIRSQFPRLRHYVPSGCTIPRILPLRKAFPWFAVSLCSAPRFTELRSTGPYTDPNPTT